MLMFRTILSSIATECVLYVYNKTCIDYYYEPPYYDGYSGIFFLVPDVASVVAPHLGRPGEATLMRGHGICSSEELFRVTIYFPSRCSEIYHKCVHILFKSSNQPLSFYDCSQCY